MTTQDTQVAWEEIEAIRVKIRELAMRLDNGSLAGRMVGSLLWVARTSLDRIYWKDIELIPTPDG